MKLFLMVLIKSCLPPVHFRFATVFCRSLNYFTENDISVLIKVSSPFRLGRLLKVKTEQTVHKNSSIDNALYLQNSKPLKKHCPICTIARSSIFFSRGTALFKTEFLGGNEIYVWQKFLPKNLFMPLRSVQ